ncbi:MAG TPA: AtaL-like protein [Steroidobacteraceae bacterium]|nr:AtaL-like protein [Steroidobacteraceae bacterium]
MYQLSRTVPVNEPGKVFLSRHDVWTGLMMKARNALPYVPQMQKCEVVEQDEDWLIRDIMLNNVPLRERVTFEPENRVIFERIGGVELGRIENIIGEDDKGNLTLTFAFGLTKQGIPEGTEAERAHFAPMEGAYLGAVAATLGAVRRTVDDQGRETIPPQHQRDAMGDTRWIYEFFRIADSLDMERFLALHTEDVRLTFANYPTTVGRDALRAAIGGLWSQIKAMSHSLSGAWSLHDGQIGIAESSCMYTRLNDTLYTVRPCTVLRRRSGKIEDVRIHVDATQL